MDDDWLRRGRRLEDEGVVLRAGAKVVPFVGLATYLLLRPSLPSRKREEKQDESKSSGDIDASRNRTGGEWERSNMMDHDYD